MKVLVVLGTRPEIIRLSCVLERLEDLCELVLVHTGQNSEPTLSDVFFEELGVRRPDYNLEITGEGFAARVAEIIAAMQGVLEKEHPDRLLVLGDTDSAMSAYVAKRMGIPVFHMEAGNRCFDDRVPEEVNRRVIDQCSDVLLPYTNRSRENLLREGFHPSQALVVGNPIKEVLDRHEKPIERTEILTALAVEPGSYLLMTLHRQETVDFEDRIRALLEEVSGVAESRGIPVLFSLHPRTRDRFQSYGIDLENGPLRTFEPFGYFDFVALAMSAQCVLTDSGTVQEECCILRVPSVTLRDSTERPETVECGSNILAGVGSGQVGPCLSLACDSPRSWPIPPEYLISEVSVTVAGIILGHLNAGRQIPLPV
jgi:UDP-N-acetylglucosamine 2-epimerase (non-hydrolysing)